MKRTSLIVSALLATTWMAACGDDDGGDPIDTPDASMGDTNGTDTDTTNTDATDTDTTDPDATDPDTTNTDATDTEVATDTDVESTDDTEATDTEAEIPDGGTIPEEGGTSSVIGAAGGIVSNASGVVLEIPPNSISTPSEITIDEAATDDRLISSAWDFQPDGITFDPPALLTLPYDAASASEAVVIAWLDGDDWVPLDGCVVEAPLVTCLVEHFTTFGVVDLDESSEEEGGVTEDTEDTEESDTEDVETDESDTEESDTDVGGECNLPPCVAQIDFESCQPDTREACTLVGGLPPTGIDICYENGVKARITPLLSEPIVVSFKTAAGAACYSIEITDAQASTINYTWKTPGGSTVMTGTVQTSNYDVVTYHCDGQDYVVDFSDAACSGPRPPDTSSTGCSGGCTY